MKRRTLITGRDIRSIVSNPVYRGVVRVRTEKSLASPDLIEWDEYPGRHEPIVSAKTWHRANAALFGTPAKSR